MSRDLLIDKATSFKDKKIIKCIKNPYIKYEYEENENDKIIITLEGKSFCKKGDFIITGVFGEKWPVSREKFFEIYDININNLTIKPKQTDITIKLCYENKENTCGAVLVPWGKNNSWITVKYNENDVLIQEIAKDNQEFWYPCKKNIFYKTYIIGENTEELKSKFSIVEQQEINSLDLQNSQFLTNYNNSKSPKL